MKIKIFLMSALLLLSFQSCSKWLDVTPKDTIAEEDLFKVATGYRNALNGVYKQMSSNSLYGKELSWGMLDVLAQSYTDYRLNTSHVYSDFAKYDYTDESTKPYLENIWTKAYNTIANCNNLIGRITDETAATFKGGELEKNLIMGEAYAVRAFLHLDILRLFAAAPVAESDEAYIPYYDKFPSLGEPNIKTSVALEKIIADLQRAQELVAPFDTINTNSRWLLLNRYRFTTVGVPTELLSDLFYSHRGYRMNYYAITAILARAYNYAGQHSEAAIEANKIIDARLEEGSPARLFTFTPFSEVSTNRKLTDDLIFTLSNLKLYENYLPYYQGVNESVTPLILNIDRGNLFEDKRDYRIGLYEVSNYTNYKSLKNVAPSVASTQTKIIEDMLPIIRMSEMYFIIAESHADKGDFIAAANSIDEVRWGRNCEKGKLYITDMTSFRNTLIKEVRRECIDEGQLFYYYKKFNIKPSYAMSSEKSFILPRPQSEDIN